MTDRDPAPWVHGRTGARVTDPQAQGTPTGGYTYLPRSGYSDYPDRYVSTRWPSVGQRHCESHSGSAVTDD